jgi:hypothetical protein
MILLICLYLALDSVRPLFWRHRNGVLLRSKGMETERRTPTGDIGKKSAGRSRV